MSLWASHLFWVSLPFTIVTASLLLPLEVRAQQSVTSNSGDYDFGWIAAGVHEPGGLPTCGRCVNLYHGDLNPNNTVDIYPCCGINAFELWYYDNSTKSIVVSNNIFNVNATQELCLNGVRGAENLTVSYCNRSLVSQQWTWEGNSGGYLYLWTLDFGGKNFSNAWVPSPLRIASSLPADDGNFTYSSNFSFLSSKNFVDRSTGELTTEGLLLISNSTTGQITNGDFETSAVLPRAIYIEGSLCGPVDYFTFCGWVVDTGHIDYLDKGILPPANGSYSIHLNSYDGVYTYSGLISQTFRTENDISYTLSFYFTGFPPNLTVQRPCSADYTQARLQVQVTSANDVNDTFLTFVTPVVDLTVQNVAASWTQYTVVFKASTNVSKISFQSLNLNSACGPMIDTVEVSPTKQSPRRNSFRKVWLEVAGPLVGVAGLITILGIIYCTAAREDYSGLYTTEHARVYSVKELSVATKKFSSVLGEGGFGTVYRADFPDGTVGAVKVEKPKGPNSSFKVRASDEVAVLLRVHHRNLVNLMGFCIHEGRHMLLFEYLPNGSLYDRLHGSVLPAPRPTSMDSVELHRLRSKVIPWKQRVRIAADVACGLEYLHHEADPPIVHRDIKSQNILLTATDSAKLADFGLSKTAPVNATSFQSIETMVKGSIGYLDPQYFSTGVFSPKSDVYSFGVVLLELISRRQAVYQAAALASWAAPYMTSSSLYFELVDKNLDSEFDADELESLVDLSKMCMQEEGKMRPNMRQVVTVLAGLVTSTGSHNHSSSSNSSLEGLTLLFKE